jgi:hypothetical protein
MRLFFYLLVVLCIISVVFGGANEPLADNELGLTAQDCASQFCKDKDGLALWLSLSYYCSNTPNPYLKAFSPEDMASTQGVCVCAQYVRAPVHTCIRTDLVYLRILL